MSQGHHSHVYESSNMDPVPTSAPFHETFEVIIILDRSCRRQSLIAVDAEIKAFMDENTTESDIIIYTDGSVVLN